MAKPRLFVETQIKTGNRLRLEGDAHHYLARVMRLQSGDVFEIFNGQSDGHDAGILDVSKRSMEIEIGAAVTPFRAPPDLVLYFAPVKKARTDFIVEKATELGVREIQPVITAFTNAERVRVDRLQKIAVEAAEQCGGTYIPAVHPPMPLGQAIDAANSQARNLIFCDERRPSDNAFPDSPHPAGILIGPEGGFSAEEQSFILASGAASLSLGPRILRADTAAIAAITLWQNRFGDWAS